MSEIELNQQEKEWLQLQNQVAPDGCSYLVKAVGSLRIRLGLGLSEAFRACQQYGNLADRASKPVAIDWSSYSFDARKPHECALCGNSLDPNWSSGGVGKLCRSCDCETHCDGEGFKGCPQPNLVKLGLIRKIRKILPYGAGENHTFTFEAKILSIAHPDGEWYPCSGPCGNWSYVDGYHDQKAPCFSVPIGWYDLDRWFEEYPLREITQGRDGKIDDSHSVVEQNKEWDLVTLGSSLCGLIPYLETLLHPLSPEDQDHFAINSFLTWQGTVPLALVIPSLKSHEELSQAGFFQRAEEALESDDRDLF